MVVFIQPTSPSVYAEDVDGAIKRLFETKSDSCISVCEINERPEWMYSINKRGLISPFMLSKMKSTRRQDLPKIYRINGAVYVVKFNLLMKKDKIIDKKITTKCMAT